MRNTLVIFLSIIATFFGVLHFTPVEDDQPKPSHHIMYITLCGKPEGVIINGETLTWVSDSFPASDYNKKLIEAAYEANHYSTVHLIRKLCPTKT